MKDFDYRKYLTEGKLLREEMELEFFNNDEDVALIANSGEYEAEIKDGKVSFSVAYEDEDDRDGMEFSENNWKSILGPNHAFVEIASKIPTEVEAIDDYVMITVDLEDLKGIASLAEGIFDRAKAKIKGAAAGIKTAAGNVSAVVKGNKDAIKDTALEVGLTKLKVKATTLNKDLDKVISDIDKLFPEKKLEKNPKLANIIDQYKISLENAKTQNAKIGKIEMKESEIKETPLNKTKMKKSELKEMIKMALSEDARTDAEQEGYKDGFDDAKDDIEDKLKDMKVSEQEEVDVEDNEKVDVDIEKDVEVDDESVETDIDVEGSMPGEDADEIAVQSLLMKAQEEAEKLGDEKLTDQIGNTITYFTRAHVATVDEAEEMDEIAALPGSTGVEDVNVDNPAEDAMVGLTESLRWQRIAGIAKDNGLYSK